MSLSTPNKAAALEPTNAHIFICRPGYSEVLSQELLARFQIESTVLHPAAVAIPSSKHAPAALKTIFARQILPLALKYSVSDPKSAAVAIVHRLTVLFKRDNRQNISWTMHAFASDDDEALGTALKVAAQVRVLVKEKYPDLAKRFVDKSVLEESEEKEIEEVEVVSDKDKKVSTAKLSQTLILQIWADSKESIYISAATPANGVIPHEAGVVRMKKIHGAPSRSSSKLVEALKLMLVKPQKGETGVDLGAAPGGWTYVMAFHGVSMTAVDHANMALPKDKKITGKVTHLKENGLKYMPSQVVDWLCCDMVMPASQTIEVLRTWIEAERMKRFVVNIKLPEQQSWPSVQAALDLLEATAKQQKWSDLKARQLFHDRNEITLMGSR